MVESGQTSEVGRAAPGRRGHHKSLGRVDPFRSHSRPGRDLGYTRFDKMAEAFGGHGELVENPEDIRPALERARAANAAGKPALVNVVTDWRVKSTTFAFTRYTT